MDQTSSAYAGDPVALDWVNRRVFANNSGSGNIQSYSMDTGLLLATSMGGGGVVQYALDSFGNVLWVPQAGGPVVKNSGTTLAQLGSVSTGISHTAHGNIMAVTDALGVNNLVLQEGGFFEFVDTDTMTTGASGTLSAGKNSLAISGPPNSGLIYAADGYIGAANATSFTLWKLTTAGVVTSIHTVNSTDIDATWANFGVATPCEPLMTDRTDGNLIVLCKTTLAVMHQNYILKLNAATGAIMWKVAVPAGVRNTGNGPSINTDMQHGMLAYIDSDLNVYCIDTIAGTVVSTVTVFGITLNFPMGSNDATGEIFVFGNYNSATMGAPTPLGSTPSSYSNLWGDLALGSGLGVGTYGWGVGGDTQFLGQGP